MIIHEIKASKTMTLATILWSASIVASLNFSIAIAADETAKPFEDPNEALKPLEQIKPNPAVLKKYGLNQQGPLLRPQSEPIQQRAPLSSIIPGNIDASLGSFGVEPNGFRSLKMTITNKTDRPIVLDGNSAVATVSGARLECASMSKIEPKIPAPDNPSHKYLKDIRSSITAIATVGAAQTLEDKLNDMQEVRKHYGFDEARREDLESRFGKRILFPGETTTGTFFIKTRLPLQDATMVIPACSLDDKSDSATLSVCGSAVSIIAPQAGLSVQVPQNNGTADDAKTLKGATTVGPSQINLERITPP